MLLLMDWLYSSESTQRPGIMFWHVMMDGSMDGDLFPEMDSLVD